VWGGVVWGGGGVGVEGSLKFKTVSSEIGYEKIQTGGRSYRGERGVRTRNSKGEKAMPG